MLLLGKLDLAVTKEGYDMMLSSLFRRTKGRTAFLQNQYWKTPFEGGRLRNIRQAITLSASRSTDRREFHIYGLRLLDVMLRWLIGHGQVELGHAQILEIGCGIGRYTLPLACRFQHVHAVDISPKALKAARNYCVSVPNVTFYANNGTSLEPLPGESVDYVLSTGVFQHIPLFEVILNYLKEGLRVLRPGGLYLFTFQVHYTAKVGSGRRGAMITARALDDGLRNEPYEIVNLSVDPKDPVPHMLALIRKIPQGSNSPKSFDEFPTRREPYRTGQFEDLPTCQDIVELWRKPQPPITFYGL